MYLLFCLVALLACMFGKICGMGGGIQAAILFTLTLMTLLYTWKKEWKGTDRYGKSL